MYTYKILELKSWIDWLRKIRECGTVIGLPKSGSNRTLQAVLSQFGYEDVYQILDLSVLPHRLHEFEETVGHLFDRYCANSVEFILIDQLKIRTKSGRRQLQVLRSQRQRRQNQFQFIFVMSEDISLLKSHNAKHASFEILTQNRFLFPYASNQEFQLLIDQNSKRFNLSIDPPTSERIMLLSGGCPFLVKNLCKLIAEDKDLEINDTVISWGTIILSQFNHSQLLALSNRKPDDLETQSLKDLGFLDEQLNTRSQIISKALEQFKIEPKLTIDQVKKTISVSNEPDSNFFSPSEKEILFRISVDRRLARGLVANICYGKRDNYSDYAIDKIVSRLRAKLVSLGFKSTVIKTQRGFGYMLNTTND